MKFLSLAMLLSVFTAAHAEASSAVYECKPFHYSNDGSPSDSGLPESFKLTFRGPKSDRTIEVTAEGKTNVAKENPWTRKSINSDTFDRYIAKNVGGLLIAKDAYELPEHFVAKIAYESDPYHGVGAWYGYNCR